ncbi:hypothetical protein [Rhizobium laguerreae]|uniref:hypothetical protein n=1 Tax=Rhizobium laguerreae TaxID=1076926 RepID=UPI0021B0ECEB|nr:hypothetical protein [Rhizobium laguerreae]
MFCDYFHSLTGSTQPALQRHGDIGPSLLFAGGHAIIGGCKQRFVFLRRRQFLRFRRTRPRIKAQEVIYDGDHKVSQLNWESMGMTLFTLGVGFMIT